MVTVCCGAWYAQTQVSPVHCPATHHITAFSHDVENLTQTLGHQRELSGTSLLQESSCWPKPSISFPYAPLGNKGMMNLRVNNLCVLIAMYI